MGRQTGSSRGSIYRRGDKWRGQITLGGCRYSHTGRTQKEVADWMSEIRNEFNHGSLKPKTPSITVQALCEEWFERRVVKTVSEQTFYKTQKMFESHLYPILGNVKVENLTRDMIENAYPKMFRKKKGKNYTDCNYCTSTIRLFASKFKACLEYAVDQGYIERNPHDRVFIGKQRESKPVQAYTPEEQRVIVKYTRNGDATNRIYYLLLSTGLRVGEAIALSWDDIDLDKGMLTVNKTAVNYRGYMEIQNHPKTKKGNRVIYLSENTVSFLKEVKNSQDKAANKLNLVLPNENYKCLHTSAIRKHWVLACKDMGITYRGVHSLRHSWATRALEVGIDVKTVSDMLGHTSVVTTMNTYQNVFAEQKKKAAALMNQML